jgi:hypothetical protein
MPLYAIVDRTGAGTVLQTFASLQASFKLPNGDWVDWPTIGHQNGTFKFYEVAINTTGSGSVKTDAAPVYNQGADTVTMARVLSNPSAPTVIDYEAFQNRFTTAEFNAATDFVYESDLVTGKPRRRAMIQDLSRATAKNSVDLLDARTVAFMDVLVAGNIVTSQRKTEILTP